MRQFFAILGDSFREAVDGFVIYAMLGLSALTMLLVGSMSFEPAPPQDAFDTIAGKFNMIIPEKGRSRSVSYGNASSTYKASDVTPHGGGYKLRLTVTANRPSTTFVNGKDVSDPKQGDSFRTAVAQWAGQAGQTKTVEVPGPDGKGGGKKGGGPKFDVSFRQPTAEEQTAVSTAQMEEFLASQFHMQAGVNATVQRVTEGVAEPTYAFDVTTAGGSGVRGWPHATKIFFGTVTISKRGTLGQTLYFIEDQIINGLGAGVALLIGVIITAFFVPNMLRKGSLDLLISKPIGRTPLLIYKYVGGLTFIFLVSTFTIGGVWLVIALRSGFWDPTFLILIPILTFSFAILYSVSVLFGVLTRSPIVAMLGTIGFMFVVWLAGWGKRFVELSRTEPDEGGMPSWLVTIIDAANTVLPRYKDLDTITSKLIIDGTLTPAEARFASPVSMLEYPSWTTTVGTSLVFIAVMLALACWRFRKRDY
jgi:ABC-type transport system involved in multi-copper enzyme maturation permease subunit